MTSPSSHTGFIIIIIIIITLLSLHRLVSLAVLNFVHLQENKQILKRFVAAAWNTTSSLLIHSIRRATSV